MPNGEPSSFLTEGRLLTVFDEHNRKLWDYVLPETLKLDKSYARDSPTMYRFADVDGDGQKEFLFGVLGLLYCFRSDGTVAWTHQPGREITTRTGQVIPAEYSIQLVETLHHTRASGGRIVIGAYQGPGATFVVELLTPQGRKVGEYFHCGWFLSILTGVLDEHGEEDIFLGGVDNSATADSRAHGITLVVLHPDRVQGQASTSEGDDRALQGLPFGQEKAVLLIREFAPNPNPHMYCRVAGINLEKGFLELHVTQADLNLPRAHYRFDSKLRLQTVMPGLGLGKILLETVLRQIPRAGQRDALQKYLGDVIYVRNEFIKSSQVP
ncbi:MAG: hypothetical protein M3Z32_00640 [Acidobacteriota bacterium]|nr:hypothetical protein [Acidobacteriota bacterium]